MPSFVCTSLLASHFLLARSWKLPYETEAVNDLIPPMVGCQPSGYSHRYPDPWLLPEHIGSTLGWDVSDWRHRMPADIGPRYAGYPPGFNVTLVYENNLGGKIWLGSQIRGDEDRNLHTCLKVEAILDLTVHEYWWLALKSNYANKGYPFYNPRTGHEAFGRAFPTQLRMQFPDEFWYHYFSRAEVWLDEQMAAGKAVMIYDTEGCLGAAALSVGYAALKEGKTWRDKYDILKVERPCIEDIMEFPEWISNLDHFLGPTYVNEWRNCNPTSCVHPG